VYVCHHVDDLLITYSEAGAALVDELKTSCMRSWGMKVNDGEVGWHLGLKIVFKPGQSVFISQAAYTESILKRFDIGSLKSASTPMKEGCRISIDDCPSVVCEADRELYQQMIGSVNYLAFTSRPDISGTVAQLCRVIQNPGPDHLAAVIHLYRYLAGTKERGLFYENVSWTLDGIAASHGPSTLVGFSDSDWAGDKDERKSTSCHVIMIAGAPIAWKMNRQKIQALSSAEAEFIAMSSAAREISYLRNLFEAFGECVQVSATTLYVDSSAAIAIAQKTGMSDKTKHIALRYFHLQELIRRGVLACEKIGTDHNVADIGTKPLGPAVFKVHADVLVKTG
jgi:hypothetical protein